jgi:hypothetical protein
LTIPEPDKSFNIAGFGQRLEVTDGADKINLIPADV